VIAQRRYHPSAIRELYEAAESYEGQRPGLGDRFADEVEDILRLIAATPAGGTGWRGTRARTWRVARFPFLVVYAVEPDEIVVVAVAHTKRRPGYWVPRLGQPHR
jgi:plasmid stabilization system protein ParE